MDINTVPPPPSCDQIINILPEPFVVIDRNYRIIAANRSYRRRYAIADEMLEGRLCHEVSHHSAVPCHQSGEHCPLEAVFDQRQPVQMMHIHYDRLGKAEYVQIQANPMFDEDGNVLYMGETVTPHNQFADENEMLIGRSPTMRRLTSLLQRVAPTQTTVLLQGESGVGKECVANYIHQYSRRADGPFVIVDCAALGENLIESELFGYEKGAFTGAATRRKGLFEAANGGTLLIDEIGELPVTLQTKLLRALETGTVRRVGGNDYIRVDVRVIAATNREIAGMVSRGEFRQDLYYRLSAFPVVIPPLRDRKDDIPTIVEHFLTRCEGGDIHLPLTPEVIEKLIAYDYPGNVRELRNIIERAVILADDRPMQPEHVTIDETQIAPRNSISTGERGDLAELLERRGGRWDDGQVLHALESTNGHRAHAAKLLGVSERTLYRYVKRLKGNQFRNLEQIDRL